MNSSRKSHRSPSPAQPASQRRSKPPLRTDAPPARSGWDHVASWYDSLVGEEGSDYHRHVILPAALRLLEIKPGERILDFCCGQGVLVPHLIKAGAGAVLGLDASANLIQSAQQRLADDVRRNIVSFVVADAMKLHPALNGSFDAVACLMAMQDLSDPDAACRSMTSALRTGGRAVIIMMHPCFRIPRQSSWGWDEARKTQFRRIDRYASDMDIPITTHPGRSDAVSTLFHHRPLALYLNALAHAGLALTGCEELCTHRRSQPGGRGKGENRAWQEFPLFLALRATRLPIQ